MQMTLTLQSDDLVKLDDFNPGDMTHAEYKDLIKMDDFTTNTREEDNTMEWPSIIINSNITSGNL